MEDKSFFDVIAGFDQIATKGATYELEVEWKDGGKYHIITILAITFSALASLPWRSWTGNDWAAQALAAGGAIMIAIDRALPYGQRWRLHQEIKAGFQKVLLDVKTAPIVPLEGRQEFVGTITAILKDLTERAAKVV